MARNLWINWRFPSECERDGNRDETKIKLGWIQRNGWKKSQLKAWNLSGIIRRKDIIYPQKFSEGNLGLNSCSPSWGEGGKAPLGRKAGISITLGFRRVLDLPQTSKGKWEQRRNWKISQNSFTLLIPRDNSMEMGTPGQLSAVPATLPGRNLPRESHRKTKVFLTFPFVFILQPKSDTHQGNFPLPLLGSEWETFIQIFFFFFPYIFPFLFFF